MTQEQFIQKAMLAMLANPNVTNGDNFADPDHHKDILYAATIMSNQDNMFFYDINSTEHEHFPECVSERECLAVIGEALQAIANKKTIAEQQKANNGNFEYAEL